MESTQAICNLSNYALYIAQQKMHGLLTFGECLLKTAVQNQNLLTCLLAFPFYLDVDGHTVGVHLDYFRVEIISCWIREH